MAGADGEPADRWVGRLSPKLAGRRVARLYRRRAVLDGPQAPERCIDGDQRLASCSNAYQGLAEFRRAAEICAPGGNL